jgi:division protein CdvB (Snf7/Vps24/ESCRT-III family)
LAKRTFNNHYKLNGEFMDRFEKDMHIILSKIEIELDAVSQQMQNLDKQIDEDVNIILEEYGDELNDIDVNLDEMRNKYRKNLYNKKKKSLESASNKLIILKRELMTVLSPIAA